MRYAIVTETYPPEINGVALTVQGLEQGLRARGHAVSVVRPRQHAGERSDARQRLVPGAGLPRYEGLRFGLPARRRLQQAWRAERPDAIYIATEGPLGWSALRAARALSIPVASALHTRFDLYMRDYGLPVLESVALRWMRHFHNLTHTTLVPTMELAAQLEQAGFAKVQRLARAVDTGRFDPACRSPVLRARWGLGADDLAVIHVGRIAAEKNLDLAVSAFRALQAARPEARFVWIGDGPLRQSLARDNPDFVFCGSRHGADLAGHFASGDLFLFPSRTETFGNVTLEAMASGVATVAFDSGAAREHLVDGRHGACVQDDDAFIRAAAAIAGDDARRRTMGAAARAATARLHPARVAADFDAILHTLAAPEHRDAHPAAA